MRDAEEWQKGTAEGSSRDATVVAIEGASTSRERQQWNRSSGATRLRSRYADILLLFSEKEKAGDKGVAAIQVAARPGRHIMLKRLPAPILCRTVPG